MHNCGYDFLNTHIDRITVLIFIYISLDCLHIPCFGIKVLLTFKDPSGPTVTQCFAYRNRLERNRLHGLWNEME